MTVVALLPMKAHSERVEGKNFRTLGHKPLFQWVLDTLLSVEEVSQVVINTDARAVLREHGLVESERVLIRDRKLELCGDLVSMNLVLADDVANTQADTYLMTHTTNPFLSAKTIRASIRAYADGLRSGRADSLFTVNKVQARFYRADGSAVNHDPNNLVRTQDLEPWYEENSNLYVFSRDSFMKTKARIGVHPRLLEMSRVEAIDIDNQEDWDLADAVANRRGKS